MAVVGSRVDHLRRHARRALPPIEGTIRVRGLRSGVTVTRDRWGVAHVAAGSTYDLYFAQGFVTASDRLFQIELGWRSGTGRLSELFGPSTLAADRWVRLLGASLSQDRVAQHTDELSREIAHAWTAGVRAFVECMPA